MSSNSVCVCRQANDQTSDEGVRWAPSRCVLVSDGFSADPGPDPAAGRLLTPAGPRRMPVGSSPSVRSGAAGDSADDAECSGSLSPVSSAASAGGST